MKISNDLIAEKKKEIVEFIISNFDVIAFSGAKNKYEAIDIVSKESAQFYRDNNHLYHNRARHAKKSLNWLENPAVWIRVISVDEEKRGKGLALHFKCYVENWNSGRRNVSELYFKKWDLPYNRKGINLKTPKGEQLTFSILNEEVERFNLTDPYFIDYLKHTFELYYKNLMMSVEGQQPKGTSSTNVNKESELGPFREFREQQATEGDLENNIVLDIEAEQIEEGYGIEGRLITYYGKRYERIPKNRKLAIQKHGLNCICCGFNFEDRYGKRGKDFIEVHHIKPLSTLEGATEVNPEIDLVPLCANCHRMIHRRKDDVLSIQQLKDILYKQRLSKGQKSEIDK